MKLPQLKQSVAMITSAVMIMSSIPVASAGTLCANLTTAKAGSNPTCSTRMVGSTLVGVPKLNWQRISDSELQRIVNNSSMNLSGKETALTGNRSALALGLDSNKVVAALQTMPSNVPFVVGKYDPLNATFRIDVLKVERYVQNGVSKVGLYAAEFTPEHGDIWKAARYYITPAERASGTVVGRNPFASYAQSDSLFHDISIQGAKVALGHAMRYVGAPTSLLMTFDTKIDVRTEGGGNAFIKKTTYIYEGHVTPKWYIGQPISVLRYETAEVPATICTTDVDATAGTCPIYATASAGVAFENFSGGMLDNTTETHELKRDTQRGLTALGAIAISVLASYAMTSMFNMIAAASSSTGATAGVAGSAGTVSTGGVAASGSAAGATGASAAVSTPVGTFGTIGRNLGWVSTSTTAAQSVAIEVAGNAGIAVMGGGSLGSTYERGPENMLGIVNVQRGKSAAVTEELPGILRSKIAPQSQGSMINGMAGGSGNTSSGQLAGYSKTMQGTCDPSVSLKACRASGANAGVVLRVDQYSQQNIAGFIKDNSTSIVRDASKSDPFYTAWR